MKFNRNFVNTIIPLIMLFCLANFSEIVDLVEELFEADPIIFYGLPFTYPEDGNVLFGLSSLSITGGETYISTPAYFGSASNHSPDGEWVLFQRENLVFARIDSDGYYYVLDIENNQILRYPVSSIMDVENNYSQSWPREYTAEWAYSSNGEKSIIIDRMNGNELIRLRLNLEDLSLTEKVIEFPDELVGSVLNHLKISQSGRYVAATINNNYELNTFIWDTQLENKIIFISPGQVRLDWWGDNLVINNNGKIGIYSASGTAIIEDLVDVGNMITYYIVNEEALVYVEKRQENTDSQFSTETINILRIVGNELLLYRDVWIAHPNDIQTKRVYIVTSPNNEGINVQSVSVSMNRETYDFRVDSAEIYLFTWNKNREVDVEIVDAAEGSLDLWAQWGEYSLGTGFPSHDVVIPGNSAEPIIK